MSPEIASPSASCRYSEEEEGNSVLSAYNTYDSFSVAAISIRSNESGEKRVYRCWADECKKQAGKPIVKKYFIEYFLSPAVKITGLLLHWKRSVYVLKKSR